MLSSLVYGWEVGAVRTDSCFGGEQRVEGILNKLGYSREFTNLGEGGLMSWSLRINLAFEICAAKNHTRNLSFRLKITRN